MKQTMTLACALKEKSRLVTKLTDLRRLIGEYNSVDAGSRRPVAVPDVIEKAKVVEENLIRIKVALAEANVGIARQLNEMMLLRGLLAFYTNLDTSDHRTKSKDDGEEVLVERDVVISKGDALARMEELQNRIDSLQDEVDEYNALHKVDIELL